MSTHQVAAGLPYPLGATIRAGGVNFAIFSRHGTQVILDIYAQSDDDLPDESFVLTPENNRTGDVWHIFVAGLKANAFYLYRIDGPFVPEKGHRFNCKDHLIDPYAKELTTVSIFSNLKSGRKNPSDKLDIDMMELQGAAGFPKCVVIDDSSFDWQGDKPLNYKMQNCVIYETHLKGFTAHKSSGVKNPGTYLGLIEKIPYLKELGITSVELLPVFEFDEFESMNINPRTGKRLTNFWGYSTIAFFAPKALYSSNRVAGGTVNEFKMMVRELHKAGIEVILDVVYNHTAEGNEHGVTISFRGIDNSIYYHLVDNQKQYYKNYSGCGNALNCNHPVVRDFILDSLRYWVLKMHIDGFRFDLGTVLGRGRNGGWIDNAPLLERISDDAILADTKIISEPWDAGGLYKLGGFFGRWAEWNDRYRDDVRNFWHGDGKCTNAAATRFTGSSDIFAGRSPSHSVNFVACHDGFTLNDVLSYGQKHNDDNGENNRDGSNNNASYNYGFEGATENPLIETVRLRQMKNLILTLLLSQGTPMMLAGDEVRRTQSGNNNAYCQDNDISYFNWELCKQNGALFDFCKKAIRFRKAHKTFRRKEFFDGFDHSGNHIPDIMWFDRTAKAPNWKELEKFFACYLDGDRAEIMSDENDNSFLIICNAGAIDISVAMPPSPYGKNWHRVVDTSYDSPNDFVDEKDAEDLASQKIYILPERSMAVFVER